jgi:hypothetical protein
VRRAGDEMGGFIKPVQLSGQTDNVVWFLRLGSIAGFGRLQFFDGFLQTVCSLQMSIRRTR